MRKKIFLAAATTSGLLAFVPTASADSPYLATKYAHYDGKPFAELDFLRHGYGIGTENDWLVEPSTYDLPSSMISDMVTGVSYWSDMLGAGVKNKQPWQIFIYTENVQNADASSVSVISTGTDYGYHNELFIIKAQLQKGTEPSPLTYDKAKTGNLPIGLYGYSQIDIGYYMGAKRTGAVNGWWSDADTVLPTNEQAADYIGTIRHELGHALGITLINGYENEYYIINKDVKDKTSWTLQLRDQNGNPAKPGMRIITSYKFDMLKESDPNLKASDFFIVDDHPRPDGNGFAYFSGPNVTEALGGAKFFGRNALPVNGWEGSDFEGSHLQTAGMMSHRDYSNYTSFMEVELAVMQDLGYQLDRKAYFGRSIYGNGGTIINTQGYFARDREGTAYINNTYSQVPLGIGLHIYGSDNTLTQAADILTRGSGATGVRVDGTGNKLIIPADTEIHADGFRGNGVLIAYGSKHTVDQSGTVTAMGDGGTAIRFDFGSSSNGANDEYRGSYIRYRRAVVGYPNENFGDIRDATNLVLTMDYYLDIDTYNSKPDELDGAMVDNYNLSGTLAGKENAVYIGKNAFVKNININDGAHIAGNITSDWKQFYADECEGIYDSGNNRNVLKIQYNGKTEENGYDYHLYIPDLVTNLNFNASMNYDGDINGNDNMKMNVRKGTLTYGGIADVVSVSVAKDASLFGGSYTVNDMTAKMAPDFSDDATGRFINHGTIGAASAESGMDIAGNLVSDGVLRAYAGGEKGHITVSGAANIDGSKVTAINALPNETWKVLEAGELNGAIGNPAGKPYAVSGMLDTTGTIDGNVLKVKTIAANNLGYMDRTQFETYNAMGNMFARLSQNGDARVNEMRTLYNFDAERAKNALSALSSNAAAQSMGFAQTNARADHVVSSRLAEPATLKTMNNDLWIKAEKNWGELKSGANYHGATIAGGWDHAFGKTWRAGAFVSYDKQSSTYTEARYELKDTRFGIYGGYSNDPHAGYAYLDFGWMKNDMQRAIAPLDLRTKANYDSRILEFGGEYKYDLLANADTTWHVSPYINMQLSELWQNGYTERGAGIFGQQADDATNAYFAGALGLEFKRNLDNGDYALRLGAKHAFSGADTKLTFGYVGDDASKYTMVSKQDKTHFVMSIGGEAEFAPGWWLAGYAGLQKGAHDKDATFALTLKKIW